MSFFIVIFDSWILTKLERFKQKKKHNFSKAVVFDYQATKGATKELLKDLLIALQFWCLVIPEK